MDVRFYPFRHICPHILYTKSWTHSLILFPIIWGTDVFQLEGFKCMLDPNEVTFCASLGGASDSTGPHTLIYFPWYIAQKGFLKASEKHIINLLLLLAYAFVLYLEIWELYFIFVFPSAWNENSEQIFIECKKKNSRKEGKSRGRKEEINTPFPFFLKFPFEYSFPLLVSGPWVWLGIESYATCY